MCIEYEENEIFMINTVHGWNSDKRRKRIKRIKIKTKIPLSGY